MQVRSHELCSAVLPHSVAFPRFLPQYGPCLEFPSPVQFGVRDPSIPREYPSGSAWYKVARCMYLQWRSSVCSPQTGPNCRVGGNALHW